MPSHRILASVAALALAQVAIAQTPPTAYTVTEVTHTSDTPGAMVIYRNGSKALMDVTFPKSGDTPAHRALTLYDLTAGVTYSWYPAATPIECNAGRFSGDWGDPFVSDDEIPKAIAKGDLKPAGTENIGGIATKLYAGTISGSSIKVWLDPKDNLVMRVQLSSPGSAAVMTMVDITKVSFASPPASLFVLPPSCAGVHPAPTAAELIAAETGDTATNYVANTGLPSGNKNSCTVVLRVLRAGVMTPVTRYQAAIDFTYNVDNPPHYVSGVIDSGIETFSGGGIHEITNQIRNGVLRIDNPPAYFGLDVNLIKPHYGSSTTVIYRQCFAPQTVLLYVVKDPDNPSAGGDFLWAKSGKFATVPPAR